MKRLIYVCLITILLIAFFVTAMNVELKEPKNNLEIRSDINNINFKCNVSTGGANIDSVRLYSDISDGWQQTGNTVFNQKEGIISFLVINISSGTFRWNCLANVPSETKFAPSNFTFSFSAPENIKPIFNGTISDQSWNQDSSLNNVINLKNYFIDYDNKPQALIFQHSGDSNIVITINNGIVSLSQPPGWFGVENVYFTATDSQDSIQSNAVKLTVLKNATNVNQTPTNTAPRINPVIPDQIKKPGDTWTLHFNSYVEDDEDSEGSLKWKIENVADNVINFTINNLTKEVNLVAIGNGEDTVKFIVEDPAGLKDDQDVLKKVTEEGETNNTTTENLLEILKKIPEETKIEIKQGEKRVFSITTTILNKVNIKWFVDDKEQDESGRKFEYEGGEKGSHKIEVVAELDSDKVSNIWQVFVNEGKNVNITSNLSKTLVSERLCGNNKTDNGEDCESCPDDVKCSEGEICKDKQCVKEGNNLITSFSIKDINLFNSPKGKIIGYVAGGVLVLVLIIIIIRTRNIRKRKASMKLTSFDTSKKGIFDRFKKEEVVKAEPKVESNVKTPSGLEPIIGFINSGLASGDRPKEIKKALLKSGWSRKQVRQAFKSIK